MAFWFLGCLVLGFVFGLQAYPEMEKWFKHNRYDARFK